MSEIKNNIEMNIKEDGGSYRSLYPINDSFTKVQTLTSLVCDVMGIPETSTPADAFLSLALGLNSYGYYITFLYPDGSPVVNAIVTGVTGINGEQLVTDSNGQVLAVSESQSIRVSIAQKQIPYFDIQALKNYSISSVGKVTNSVVNLSQKSGDYQLVTSSQSIQFSSLVDTVDFTAVGGGGGGAGAEGKVASSVLGAGGGGGYVNTIFTTHIKVNEILNVKIGSGGKKIGVSGGSQFVRAGAGGTTLIENSDGSAIITASGGTGGTASMFTGGGVKGGVGNGNGGTKLVNGGDGTGSIFDEFDLGIAGGGGGGGEGALGGSPNGAKGCGSITDAGFAGIGGGGGAGRADNSFFSSGSDGGVGAVYIRWEVAS